jgi:hypothetical protein
MRRPAVALCFVLCLASPAFAEELKVHGFVTAIHSPESFEIDDYKITCDPGLSFKTQRDAHSSTAPATFKHEDVRVGTEVEVEGEYYKSTSELKASSVKVFFFDTVDIDRIALVENVVHLNKTASGAWDGEFFVDGQRVIVSEKTTVSIAQSLGDLDSEKPAKASTVKASAKTPVRASVRLDSLDSVRLDSFVHYQGTVSAADGSITATKVEFEDGGVERGIVKAMKRTAFKAKDPNYVAGKPGQLEIRGATGGLFPGLSKSYELPPSREAQDYI